MAKKKKSQFKSAFQNVLDLWTSIGDKDQAYNHLPVISDGYRDAAMEWEADFCHWLWKNGKSPKIDFDKKWYFMIAETVQLNITPQAIKDGYLKNPNKQQLSGPKEKHILPHTFAQANLNLGHDSPAKVYYLSLLAFMCLSEQHRSTILQMDCLH